MEAVASAWQGLPWMVRAVDLRVLRQAQELPEEPEEGGEAMSPVETIVFVVSVVIGWELVRKAVKR